MIGALATVIGLILRGCITTRGRAATTGSASAIGCAASSGRSQGGASSPSSGSALGPTDSTDSTVLPSSSFKSAPGGRPKMRSATDLGFRGSDARAGSSPAGVSTAEISSALITSPAWTVRTSRGWGTLKSRMVTSGKGFKSAPTPEGSETPSGWGTTAALARAGLVTAEETSDSTSACLVNSRAFFSNALAFFSMEASSAAIFSSGVFGTRTHNCRIQTSNW